ncbi:hypothetical protein FAZ69_23215 [Trinickia terrae]|uniref:Ig-like domain-containing protein n=1 Tax=Trinickia terrae TaxID=2571161 RepID=A0A4U1HTY7_9BURK|nr:hypothetical protein [Trinickia terrae]TKC83933.1 hypothetical protein FAZ69_23215 [Trinickia terrae]
MLMSTLCMRIVKATAAVLCVPLLLLGLASLTTPALAQITLNPVVCNGTDLATYSPPLINTEQSEQIQVSEQYSKCEVLDGSGITGASANYSVTRNLACTDVTGGPGMHVIQWSDGETSAYSYTVSDNFAAGNAVILFSGTITAGRYLGQTAITTFVISSGLSQANALSACAGPGINQLRGTATLVIAPKL